MSDTVRIGKDKLFNFRPVFFVAAFLGLGAVFSCLHLFYGISLWWLLLLLGLGFSFAFCGKSGLYKTGIAVGVLVFSFFLGMNIFAFQVGRYADATYYEGVHTIQGRVEERTDGKWKDRVVLSNISVDGKAEKFKLIAYLPSSFCEETELFDVVTLEGVLTTYEVEYGGEAFDVNAIRAGIKYSLQDVESWEVTGHEFALFGWMRARVERVVYSGMDEDPAAVTLAVLTGNTDGIEEGLIRNMRYGGIAHIFAVSGLHVGSLFAFCLWITAKTKLKKLPKPVRFLLVAFILIFYGGICGFSASILRATILCLVGYAAKLIGTSVDKFEALGAAAILVLLISPVDLFSVGFQLSFLACLGIFLWSKPLEKWGNHICDEVIKRGRSFRQNRQFSKACAEVDKPSVTVSAIVRSKIVSFLSVSTAAQIATAPVLLHTFGYLSGWSLLLNCLFVPFISGLFALLLISVALGCVLPVSVVHILLYLPNVIWSAALLVFEAVDFSSFALQGITFTAGSFVCYYVGLSFFSDKWNLTPKQRKWFVLICALGLVIILLAVNIPIKNAVIK